MEKISISKIYPPRSHDGRKGDYGRIVVAGGSERYTGCLVFNALAALRAGADLVTVVAPRRAADIVASHSPDLITVPCDSPFPEPRLVSEVAMNADALVVGCGVVRSRESHRALISMIAGSKIPVVADAEALHAIAELSRADHGRELLLTPNAGEYQVLAGSAWPRTEAKRRLAVKALAKRFRSAAVVKGSRDWISDGNRVAVDLEGSPYMTKGGYGDLLAGAASAFLARGKSAFDAARMAAFLVGRAGMIASRENGEGTLASDALDSMSRVAAFRR